MGVTIVVCAIKGCGRMLNGELCCFQKEGPLCEQHANERHGFIKDTLKNN